MSDHSTREEFERSLSKKRIVNFSLIHFENGQYWANERTDPNAREEALAANRRLVIWQAAKEQYAPDWMPILGTCLSIPMRILDEAQAKANHRQSLARLKERGGLSLEEAVAIAERRKYTSLEAKKSLAILTQLAAGDKE